jgi:hypothetical protein
MPNIGNFVPVNQSATPQAVQLERLILLLQQIIQQSNTMFAIANAAATSSQTWANVESLFGLPTADSGANGQALWNALNGINTACAAGQPIANLANLFG